MNATTKNSMLSLYNTCVGKQILREIDAKIISAAKYYMGAPDGLFFKTEEFDESVVNAKKAYITLNTLMGGENSEKARYTEGKKQTTGLITVNGIKKIIELFTYLFFYAMHDTEQCKFETVRACRRSEIEEGTTTVKSLTSTTKLHVDEIMMLGYGNKNELAICKYKFHEGAIVFDMEKLGDDYLKQAEREVLILMGNRQITKCVCHSSNYHGKDMLPAAIYEIHVYPPINIFLDRDINKLESIVYNEKTIDEVRKFYHELNCSETFPAIPECYKEWKNEFQQLVFHEIVSLLKG